MLVSYTYYSRERRPTEKADNDPSYGHDPGPAGIKAIAKETGSG